MSYETSFIVNLEARYAPRKREYTFELLKQNVGRAARLKATSSESAIRVYTQLMQMNWRDFWDGVRRSRRRGELLKRFAMLISPMTVDMLQSTVDEPSDVCEPVVYQEHAWGLSTLAASCINDNVERLRSAIFELHTLRLGDVVFEPLNVRINVVNVTAVPNDSGWLNP